MHTLIGNELLKLGTLRSPLLLLAAAQLVIAAGVSGLFVSGAANPQDPATALRAVAHAGLVSIFSLILGITAVAGEHRHKTITDTYLSTPRRGRVIAAKVAVYSATGAIYGLISATTATAVTAGWLAAKDVPLQVADGQLWSTLAGCVTWNALFAAIGVGVGALVRNLTAAVAAALAWLALVEGIVGQLIGDLGRWLPFASGLALEDIATPGVDLLPQWGAAVVLTTYAATFALLAAYTTVRRDVS